MPEYRIDRISKDIQKELVEVLAKIKDPRVHRSMLSVLRIDVTNDLSFATVYVSTLGGMEDTKVAVEGLNSAKGFIKREIGNRLSLRKMPELIFSASDSIAYSAEINQILQGLEGDTHAN